MVKTRKVQAARLNDRFSFDEDSFPGGMEQWTSRLSPAIGRTDGEHYLLRLFKKTGTGFDQDLRRFIDRGIRRVRRVLSSRQARDILVEIVEVAEDDDEIAIVMLDPGAPLAGTSRRARARQDRFLVAAERKTFWRNMLRVAEGLTLCHDAGIVHGAVSTRTIFSHKDSEEDYRLGGYEACIHIADSDLAGAGASFAPTGVVSFRQDWIDLGRAAAEVIGLSTTGGPSLLAGERRILDRLANPPQFQLFNGHIILRELKEVLQELELVGASPVGELVLFPSRQVLLSDLPSLTSGTVRPDDTAAILRFVEDDLGSPDVRIAGGDDFVRLITDLAIYGVKLVEPTIGTIVSAAMRTSEDWSVLNAVELGHRLRLCENRAGANDRVLRLGRGARQWRSVGPQASAADLANDVPAWYALLLLEAFSLLREQFRIYPVRVVRSKEAGLIWAIPLEQSDRDARRETLGMRPAAEALKRELEFDDGKISWILSKTDQLGGESERRPQLTYEGTDKLDGGALAYSFTASDLVSADQYHFLRPKPDVGSERAIQRRLRNIVSARSNVELLRALDDPGQVALDDALRDIAKPGPSPEEMDPSKKQAWESIVAGRSINAIVGPPGVGKTYLITALVQSILSKTRDARILVSAQNHDTLEHVEDELRKVLPAPSKIVVRVEPSRVDDDESSLRESSKAVLKAVAPTKDRLMANQYRQIEEALALVDGGGHASADRVYRDTDNLLLRSADVTLASTSSYVIEEMVADGEQFDWVIIEEAARANGSELIGALLLGNRRVIIGDHNQLSPFDAIDRQKFYDEGHAAQLLTNARKLLEALSDLPPELDTALERLTSQPDLLKDVLAIAARMEEPFRSIAKREEDREKATGQPSSFANMLLEQSRMHPALGDIVSNTFYGGKLKHSDRVRSRSAAVSVSNGFPNSPFVVLNLPALSKVAKRAFERNQKRSFSNESEAVALVAALKHLHPVVGSEGRLPTLAVLSPYNGQVSLLESLLKSEIDAGNGTLAGFASPRSNGKFVFSSDSFQGSEADLVLASLVRNNVLSGTRALGFIRSPQRVNVLLSRAKHKLVLATSIQFIADVVDGTDPDRVGGELNFLRTFISEATRLTDVEFEEMMKGSTILEVDERGKVIS